MEAALAPEDAAALRRLGENVAAVEAQIEAACRRSGRPPGSVALLPVVKDAEDRWVRLLAARGQRDLAEGTVQGGLRRREALGAGNVRLHLVGHLQRNKARRAVEIFQSLHSLDSPRLAEKLEEELALAEARAGARAAEVLPVIYLEVNIASEANKGGVAPGEVEGLLRGLAHRPRVARRLTGLMAMAPHREDPEAARPHFSALRAMRDRLEAEGLLPPGAGLSMGMSGDYAVAVEEGATVVRVGSRLFEGLEPATTPMKTMEARPAERQGRPCV